MAAIIAYLSKYAHSPAKNQEKGQDYNLAAWLLMLRENFI
jgi:hypothetical protein